MDIESLYPHNREAYEAVMNHFEGGNQKACIVHATGTGKSYVIGAVADHFDKVLVVAPNNYITSQVQSVVDREDVDYITYTQLLFDAEAGKISQGQYDLIVFDEFHRTGAKRWTEGVQRVMNQNPQAKIFGTSATPIRYLDNGRDIAEELFEGQVMSTLTVQDAWIRGILVPPVYVVSLDTFDQVKEDTLHKINSKYVPAEARAEMLRQLETAQQAWDKSGGVPGVIRDNIHPDINRVLVFCPNIDTIEDDRKAVEDWFRQAGIPVEGSYVIDSSRPEKDNMAEMERFQQDDGQGCKIMISVNMLNEGIHVPRVDALLMLRRTVSMNIYLQQIGRCMAATGDNHIRPVILDLQNNLANVGQNDFFSQWDDEYLRSVEKNDYSGESRNMTVKGVAIEIMNAIQSIGGRFEEYRKNFDWNINYAEAKAFFDQHGRFPTYKENSILYHWANHWTKYYYQKNPELYQEKADMLAAVGFVYQSSKDRNDEMWMKNYTEAKTFFEEHGRFPKANDNKRLYQWCMAWWKRSYIKNPAINESKAQMLREIGFEHQANDERLINLWNENYTEAKAFFDQHGRFPASSQQQKLYDWAKNWWRINYLQKPELNQEKADMLLAIGFVPKEAKSMKQLHDELWMKNYLRCKEFFDEHGHFPTIKEDSHLYQWAKQWWILSYLKNPEKYQEKADKLVEVGYAYRTAEQMNEDKWMKKYLEAKALYDKNGHFPTETENQTSKKWARSWVRNIYARDPIKYRQKAEMLRAIGLDIEDKIASRITNPVIIKHGTGYAIRCKIDGEQQMARPLSQTEEQEYEKLVKEGLTSHISDFSLTTAEKHFKSVLSAGTEKENKMKR